MNKGDGMPCETVLIRADVTEDNPHGHIRINKADFDEKKHVLVEDEEGAENFDAMTKAQLKEHLEAKGVEFETDANKAVLVELCKANP